jgi:hypothetical protein
MTACNLNVFTPEQRQRHEAVWQQLNDLREAIQEISSGYVFQYPAEALPLVAEYVSGERLCCPFLHFTLDIEPGSSSMRLQLTGGEEVKPFLKAQIGF